MWSTCIGCLRVSRRRMLGIVPAVLCQSCRSQHSSSGPSITCTRIPQADPAESARNDIIEGRVTGALPGQKIELYANAGMQPLNEPAKTLTEATS